MAGSPCGHSASKEIGVLCPDWTTNCQCGGQNRPVCWIPLSQPFPSFCFELTVGFASNQFHKTGQRAQECERLSWIATVSDDERRQMLFGFSVRPVGDEKTTPPGVRLDHFTHALSQDGPYENIGVNHQRFTWHCASSRGQPGGSPCTPPSTLLRRCPRTRSSRPGLSRRRAWLPIRLPASLLCRDIEPERLAVSHDRQRRTSFEVAREVFAEFTHADLNCFHTVAARIELTGC